MTIFHDVYRHMATQSVAANSTASVTTASFGSQTYYIRIAAIGVAGSTAGVYYTIGSPPAVPSSVSGILLPVNVVDIVKVTPGQQLAALTAAAGVTSVFVTQLTD